MEKYHFGERDQIFIAVEAVTFRSLFRLLKVCAQNKADVRKREEHDSVFMRTLTD